MRRIKRVIKTNRGKSYMVECVNCKKEFKVKRWDFENIGKGTYCSNKCRGEFQKRKLSGSKNYNWKGGKVQRRCKICGKRFMVKVKDTKGGRGTYCSSKCKDYDHSRVLREYYRDNPGIKNKIRHMGLKNGRWLGGKSFEPYSFEFNDNLKQQIKGRDGNRCKLCDSCKNLNIHHIDYNKRNNNLNNLITLCSKCHGKTNTNRQYWQKILSNLI